VHIAILGTGTMGKAVIHGLCNQKDAVTISAFDTFTPALDNLPEAVSVLPPKEWFTRKETIDAVLFAVKPVDIHQAVGKVHSFQSRYGASPLWISIAAGISIATLAAIGSEKQRICRVMPNTPAKIGEGISAYACTGNCSKNDIVLIEQTLKACGKTIAVPEKLLHAVTGLSGSGPAYVFLFIEALIEGGVTAGLPFAVARECALQTVIGAAKLAAESTDHTGALKAGVMSPGGTTTAGLRALERHAFKHAVIDAVLSATSRSAQLGVQS
jgi:pyrroline-5-carboxylate reductase